MPPDTRAVIAASAFALITRKKVAGLYEHATGRHLRIAAEARGEHLQGYDGDRDARFGGTLPDLLDATGYPFAHVRMEPQPVQIYDRRSSRHLTAHVTAGLVQLYDHAEGTWHTFAVNTAPAI